MPSARPPQDTKKWMPAPPALVRAFDGAVQSVRGAERRKMFGYPAVFVNGSMFAGLVRDRMILRLADRDRERFLALPGRRPSSRWRPADASVGGRFTRHGRVAPGSRAVASPGGAPRALIAGQGAPAGRHTVVSQFGAPSGGSRVAAGERSQTETLPADLRYCHCRLRRAVIACRRSRWEPPGSAPAPGRRRTRQPLEGEA